MKKIFWKIYYKTISILISLLPYFLVEFRWYRRLIYAHCSTQYQPLHLLKLDKILEKGWIIHDIHDYVEIDDLQY